MFMFKKKLEMPAPGVPRLFLLEAEYAATVVRAEVRWLRSVIEDLYVGKLKFPSAEEIRPPVPPQSARSAAGMKRPHPPRISR